MTLMQSGDMVHTSAYSGLNSHLVAIRKACGVLTYDLSDDWTEDLIREICPSVSIAFLSASDLSEQECRALSLKCMDYGARHVVITRGEHGALACVEGEFFRQDAMRSPVKDTMGAGDAFIAAYLMARASNCSTEQSLLEGVVYAASACRHSGGFGHAFPITKAFNRDLKNRFRPDGQGLES
jgi:fructoselysine 6-kinase